MFFGSDAGHGLEPVCIVGRTFIYCPLLHCLRDLVCSGNVERSRVSDGFLPRLVTCGGETVFHGLFVEDHAPEQFGETPGFVVHMRNLLMMYHKTGGRVPPLLKALQFFAVRHYTENRS